VSNERLEQEQKPIVDYGGPLRGQMYIGGKYRILELLGTGGMGAVYKVKHEMLDQIFAIKVLDKATSTEEKTIRRFDQEAKASGALRHENLIGIHDYGVTDDGIIYIVMDYLDGTSLDNEIKTLGHIDEKRAIDIFAALCRGLSYAHEKGIIHRDLKPSNIMLTRDEKGVEVPKIVDFGIAKRQAVESKLTQTGELFGTPLYMSPEQCMGYPLDARSDIYSLGCVMFEALSGTNPFIAENAMATIMKHLNDEPPPWKANETVSAGMRQLVASCLEKDVNRRPQSAEVLLANLESVRSGKQPSPLDSVKRVRRKHIVKFVDILFWLTVPAALAVWGWQHITPILQPSSVLMAKDINKSVRNGDYAAASKLAEQAAGLAKGQHLTAIQQVKLFQSVFDAYHAAHEDHKAADAASNVVEAARKLFNPSVSETTLVPQYELQSAIYGMQFDPTRSLAYLSDGVEREELLSREHPEEFVDYLYTAGRAAAINGYYHDAIPYFKRAFDLNSRHISSQPERDFTVAVWLMSAYLHERQYDLAERPLIAAERMLPQTKNLPDLDVWKERMHHARMVIDKKVEHATRN